MTKPAASGAETTDAVIDDTIDSSIDQPDYEALYKQAQQESQTWKSRHAGIQGKYQQEQRKWQDTADKLVTVQEQVEDLSGLREQLEVQNTELTEKLDTFQTDATVAQEQLDRLTIVTKEFPQLVPFLQDDLIPDATGDDLRTKLTAFDERLTTMRDKKLTDFVEGASPKDTPPPVDQDKMTSKAILGDAVAALQGGDVESYNTLYDQYLVKESKEANNA